MREDDELLLERSDAVVVCSADLARTRGAHRDVDVIPNGVDVNLFRTPQARPAELPPGPVAVYVGTLHEERIDVPLLVALAEARPNLQIALVGPDRLGPETSARLAELPSIHLIGAQPYGRIPGFLQHADLIVIPHLVNPFTESLDPIKAYECQAAGRPTVATPVAGFRELGPPIVVVDRSEFIDAVASVLDGNSDGNEPEPTTGRRTHVAGAGRGDARCHAPGKSRSWIIVTIVTPRGRTVTHDVRQPPYPCACPHPPKASHR